MSVLKRKVLHVDDSAIALRIVGDAIKRSLPEAEIQTFTRGKELIESLDAMEELPWMIFSDVTMPGVSGMEVLQRIKRSPRLHMVPVIMVTAEVDEACRLEAMKSGALAYLEKPLHGPKLIETIQRYEASALSYADLRDLDRGFVDEALDLVEEMHKVSAELNEGAVKELYRLFHTVKGGSNSIQFPHLGVFMHLAEGFLTALQNGNMYQHPMASTLLVQIFAYVESQAEQLKKGTLLDLPSPSLVDDIKLFKTNVEAGWSAPKGGGVSSASQAGIPQTEATAAAGQGVVSRSSSSLRVTNEKMDELQDHLKKVLQLRTRMSQFANQLKSEFTDEAFPNDLVRMVDSLQKETMEAMEFFISLRVVPASRVKMLASRVVTQTSDSLQKMVRLDFTADPHLEIDQVIVEALEAGLTHVLRNAVDHGLEPSDSRVDAGKDPIGVIQLDVQRDGNEKIKCVVQDDGGGINRDALKKAVAAKGLISLEKLNLMTPENIEELIFMDGLSTKTDVTDVSGRGVGLSAVKERMLALGGSIVVSSVPGKGTRFEFTLPRIFRL